MVNGLRSLLTPQAPQTVFGTTVMPLANVPQLIQVTCLIATEVTTLIRVHTIRVIFNKDADNGSDLSEEPAL